MKPLFPMFVNLNDHPVLVVGAGKVGRMKIRRLLDSGARLTVVAPHAEDEVLQWAGEGRIHLEQRPFRDEDVEGKRIVICATPDRAVNEAVSHAGQKRGVLVNVADVPDLCDFYMASVVRRGRLQVAFSTQGASPALARRLRERFEEEFPPSYEGFLELMVRFRAELRRRWPKDGKQRMDRAIALLDTEIFATYEEKGEDTAWQAMLAFLDQA